MNTEPETPQEPLTCETCGDLLNEDGLCNICDNYLYDHEE